MNFGSLFKFWVFGMQLGKNAQNYGHTLGQNKHGRPIFSLQFFNVLYVVDINFPFQENSVL